MDEQEEKLRNIEKETEGEEEKLKFIFIFGLMTHARLRLQNHDVTFPWGNQELGYHHLIQDSSYEVHEHIQMEPVDCW